MIDLIMDSGAFSAWMKKIEISIDEYIDFCLKHIKHITYVVNLDVIPGEYGQTYLPIEERERAARKGWENYKRMLKGGIPKEKLIHVFHQDEDFKWLEKMISSMEYIGLSPANDRGTAEKVRWLDECMDFVTDSKGIPIVKFHGFAVTSHRIMKRYPWYSVDSTTWTTIGRNGGIIVPKSKNKIYDYSVNYQVIAVSENSPKKEEEGMHINSFPELQKRGILEYIKNKGFTLEEVQSDYKKRDQLNIIYFLDLEKSMPKWPWAFKHKRNKGFDL